MSNPSNALVPVSPAQPPAVVRSENDNPLSLVKGAIKLTDKEDVRNRLPDILGRALARTWIDTPFHESFSRDPQATLAAHGVEMPDNMVIEFQKPDSNRPRIVVYEKKPHSKFRTRIFYLQLVMMAGR
ncbi:MAG: hypothetical protein CBC12_11250 [Candidatus Puniceispirillum sp. TMED52]|nr:hypothetical protein [SAR116 cluster bacterium]OUU46659.1 MAG: hypothetical protein CBC12_11250 [Candidatus Puniceispirillum sp. TMED52]